jgi:Gas vesicle synthesis protein GvpL/GvpF
MSSPDRLYVFCVIQERDKQSLGKATLNGQENEVFTLHYKNAAMVVTHVNGEVLPDRHNLFAHQETITEVMKRYSVIPMSFGNVFSSEEDVLLIMKHVYDEFNKIFKHIENKIEVGLKVMAKPEWIQQEMKKNKVLQEWKSSNKDVNHPASFYDQIQLGEQAQHFVLGLESQVETDIYEPLLELADAGKQNNTIPGKVLLNAAFLIDRDQEQAFDERVNELYEKWQDKAAFHYSGPWPAYNFVNIRLRIE